MINDFIKKGEKRLKKDKEVPETDIENHYCRQARKRGCKALKLIILRKRGFPDRTTLCPDGRIFFIEFKKKDKPLTGQQPKIKRMLEQFGFKYFVCDEIGQAEEILDKFLNRK